MSAPALAILVIVAGLVGITTVVIVGTSARLRDEIDQLFQAFNRTEPALVPLRVTVDSERDRLRERLANLSDPGSGTDVGHR